MPSSGGECSPEEGRGSDMGPRRGGLPACPEAPRAALTRGGGDGCGWQAIKADGANLLDVAGREGHTGAQVAAGGGQHCCLLLH